MFFQTNYQLHMYLLIFTLSLNKINLIHGTQGLNSNYANLIEINILPMELVDGIREDGIPLNDLTV